jgi:hypothetical protein
LRSFWVGGPIKFTGISCIVEPNETTSNKTKEKYKVKIYIWYQSFVGFKAMPLWSTVFLKTVIILVRVGYMWYLFF